MAIIYYNYDKPKIVATSKKASRYLKTLGIRELGILKSYLNHAQGYKLIPDNELTYKLKKDLYNTYIVHPIDNKITWATLADTLDKVQDENTDQDTKTKLVNDTRDPFLFPDNWEEKHLEQINTDIIPVEAPNLEKLYTYYKNTNMQKYILCIQEYSRFGLATIPMVEKEYYRSYITAYVKLAEENKVTFVNLEKEFLSDINDIATKPVKVDELPFAYIALQNEIEPKEIHLTHLTLNDFKQIPQTKVKRRLEKLTINAGNRAGRQSSKLRI